MNNSEIQKEENSSKIDQANFYKARFRNHFDIGKKEYRKIFEEQFSKIRIAGLSISILTIVVLIAAGIYIFDYRWIFFVLILLPLSLIVAISISIFRFLNKIDSRIRDRKKKINYDIYLFKSSMVVRTYICEDKFKVKMRSFAVSNIEKKEKEKSDEIGEKCELIQERIKYEEIIKIVESKRYIYLITKDKVHLINKRAKYKKRKTDTLDMLRKYIQEKTHLYMYLSYYKPDRIYESYYELNHQLTVLHNASYVVFLSVFLLILIPLLLNFTPDEKYQYVWTFWLGGILSILAIVGIFFVKYKKSHTTWRSAAIISLSVAGIVSSLAFGINGTIINRNLESTEDLNNAISLMDFSLPENFTLNSNTDESKVENDVTYYRYSLALTFNNDEEIYTFESELFKEDSIWRSEYDIDSLKIVPDDVDTSLGQYYLIFDEIDQRINPTYEQVDDNSIIWYLNYNVNTNQLYSYNYNITDQLMY